MEEDFGVLIIYYILLLKILHMLNNLISNYFSILKDTWFDRPLTLAGKVIYKEAENKIQDTLFHYPKPLVLIPNLAPHLQSI